MNQTMKILIAHDGSSCSDAALEDLKKAGLPSNATVQLLSVADVWVPPPGTEMAAFPETFSPGLLKARTRTVENEEEARALAGKAAARLRGLFPAWQVSEMARVDGAAWAILKQAATFAPDLIVVGSHGRGALVRAVLGSVSQRVAGEAACTVRVARGHVMEDAGPPRIVVGVDGSAHSTTTVNWVASRHWPAGTAVHVVAFVDFPDYVVNATDFAALPLVGLEDLAREETRLKEFADSAVGQLRACGLLAAALVGRSDPRRGILHEAERWGADSVFVGAHGHTKIERVLGTTSQYVAARAHCSVELVR